MEFLATEGKLWTRSRVNSGRGQREISHGQSCPQQWQVEVVVVKTDRLPKIKAQTCALYISQKKKAKYVRT